MIMAKFLLVMIGVNVISNIVFLTIDVYADGDWTRLSALLGWIVAFVGQIQVVGFMVRNGEE